MAGTGTWQTETLNGMQYLVLLPDGYVAGKQYPVLMFLHGGNQASQLPGLVNPWFNTPDFRASYSTIVVAPMLPPGAAPGYWGGYGVGGTPTPDSNTPAENNVLAITRQVITQYGADANRIYLTGLSAGGYASWDLMIKDNAYDGQQGRLFAAAFSLSGDELGASYSSANLGAYSGTPTQAVINELNGVPIWAVNTPVDRPTWDEAMATALPNSAYHYTEIPTANEDTWDSIYPLPNGKPYYDWLFSQSANLVSNSSTSTSSTSNSTNPLFDAAYYLAQNPDVAAAGIDPYQHFLATGWKEGRNPDPLFNTQYYLKQNPDVAQAGVDPLLHYEQTGWTEGRDPSYDFSTIAYLQANPDVEVADLNPLIHYEATGAAEGRMTFMSSAPVIGQDPLVNNAFVEAQYPDAAASGLDPTTYFNTIGWKLGENPDAFFNTQFYLKQNPDVAQAGIDPLFHYEQTGWKEGRDPSYDFSTIAYLQANPDVVAAGLNPLIHYEASGVSEGRMTFISSAPVVGQDPLVNNAFVEAQYPDAAASGLDPTTYFNTIGWKLGENPDSLFDTKYYLANNPDVAAAGIDPLQHYEQFGWQEGRNPSGAFSTDKYLAANPDVAAAAIDPLLHYESSGQFEGRGIFPA